LHGVDHLGKIGFGARHANDMSAIIRQALRNRSTNSTAGTCDNRYSLFDDALSC
jgi:hypothetical protein